MSTDEVPAVARVATLKGHLTPAARERIAGFLGSFRSFEPTLGLLYGDLEGRVAGRPSWSIMALAPRVVDELVEMYGSFGAVVTYELDGFRVIVPQLGHIAELDGVTLDFTGNRLCAVEPT